MKINLLFVYFVAIQLVQFRTEGQLIEIDVPKHMENANKLYGRLVRGAQNLMSLPLVRRYPSKSKSTNENSRTNYEHEAQAKAAEIKAFAVAKAGGFLNFLGAPLRMFYEESHDDELPPNHIESLHPHTDMNTQETNVQNLLSGGSGGWGQPSHSIPHFESSEENHGPPQGYSYEKSPPSYNSIPRHPHDSPPTISYSSAPSSSYGPPSRPSKNPPPGWSSPPPESSYSYGPPSGSSHKHKSGPSYIRLSRPSGPTANHGWGPQSCDSVPADRIRFFPGDVLPPGWFLEDPFGKRLNPEDVIREGIPNPPISIRIGIREPLPENHTIAYVERVEINQPHLNGIRSGYDIRMEAHYKGDTILATPSLLDISNRPKLNTIQVTTQVIKAPNNTAPLGGFPDPEFTLALQRKDMLLQNTRLPESPLQSQIRVLGEVFSQLQAMEEGPGPLPPQRHGHNSYANTGSEIEAPIIVLQVQKFTIADPDTSESVILDSFYNFGLPAYQMEFGDQNVIAESWELQRNNPQLINVNQLGSNLQEISDTFRGWVKQFVRNGRKASSESYNRAESKAYQGFAQYQYFLVRPGQCPAEVDPPAFGSDVSIACANGNTRSTGPPPEL